MSFKCSLIESAARIQTDLFVLQRNPFKNNNKRFLSTEEQLEEEYSTLSLLGSW